MLFDIYFFVLKYTFHLIIKYLLKNIKHCNCMSLVDFILKCVKNFDNLNDFIFLRVIWHDGC